MKLPFLLGVGLGASAINSECLCLAEVVGLVSGLLTGNVIDSKECNQSNHVIVNTILNNFALN